jgi:hypothetical protein
MAALWDTAPCSLVKYTDVSEVCTASTHAVLTSETWVYFNTSYSPQWESEISMQKWYPRLPLQQCDTRSVLQRDKQVSKMFFAYAKA